MGWLRELQEAQLSLAAVLSAGTSAGSDRLTAASARVADAAAALEALDWPLPRHPSGSGDPVWGLGGADWGLGPTAFAKRFGMPPPASLPDWACGGRVTPPRLKDGNRGPSYE